MGDACPRCGTYLEPGASQCLRCGRTTSGGVVQLAVYAVFLAGLLTPMYFLLFTGRIVSLR